MGDRPSTTTRSSCVVGRRGRRPPRRAGSGIREVRILEEPFTEEPGRASRSGSRSTASASSARAATGFRWSSGPATATDEQYRFYLRKTAEANFNMLRIWGGGIYERDIFYDLCDELGIMVWQDFMFASAGYPVDRLRDEIIAEAEYQIRRLRNHPCVVLWCGCNEDVLLLALPERAGRLASADDRIVAGADGGRGRSTACATTRRSTR